MAKRTVDPAMLQGLVSGAMTQEPQKGSKKTSDPNFPVFATPVNEDILVYFPRTNLITTENGEEMQLLPSLIHDAKIGKAFTSLRCINGLVGPGFDALGYDGSCPACEGMGEVWDLYNAKMKAEATRMGIDLGNDPGDSMKPIRENILREMDLKNPEEFVTFAICIIPTKARFTPSDDADKNVKTVYVQWRRKRYNESITGALEAMVKNPGHPAGMFWLWKFSYDTEGKPATAMMSAKNAKYTPITGDDATAFARFIPICEASAKDFTLLKAAEVVVANQFLYKEDLEGEVNKILSKTRTQLEQIKMGGIPTGLEGGQQAQIGAASNALEQFGTAPAPTANLGTAPQQDPTQAQNPVTFG